MDFEQIGARIKKCRREQNYTQEKFAECIDVSPHYIYEIERGSKTMSLYTLESVASHLGVSIDYLIYGVPSSQDTEFLKKKPDKLEALIDIIPSPKRDTVAELVKAILPLLK